MVFWDLLIIILLILPTVHYRVNVGLFSFNTVEPFVIVTTFLLFGAYIHQRKRLYFVRSPFLIVILVILLWTALIRPWALDWQNGFSDIRDWLFPLFIFFILNILARNKWEHWSLVIISWMLILAVFGIIQHVINGARPFVSELASYKTGFDIFTIKANQQLSHVSYAVGFSSHPNSYGLFLLNGFLLTLGWVVKQKKGFIYRFIILAIIAMGLYWSYAKSSIFILIGMVFIFLLLWRVKSLKVIGLILAIFGFIAIIIIGNILPRLPAASFSTFWWRVGLWKIALELIIQQPQILLTGNGIDIFAQSAYFFQPHNLYIEYLLQYGIPGLLLLFSLILMIIIQGWKYYQNGWFHKEPRLLGLWLALLSYFAVGITESTFLDIEKRAYFLIFLAAFEGLHYERMEGKNFTVNNAKIVEAAPG